MNAVQIDVPSSHETTATDTSQVMIPRVSFEQVQRFLSLIDVRKGGYEKLWSKVSRLIDSGTLCHITCNLKQINDVKTIRPIPLCLPNHTHTLATKKGALTLEKGRSLRDVLYVPELNCNLLSVAKLGTDLNCIVTFFDDSSVLQDRTSRILIVAGE